MIHAVVNKIEEEKGEPHLGTLWQSTQDWGFTMAEVNDDKIVIRPTLALIALVVLIVGVGLLIFIMSYQVGFNQGMIIEEQDQINERLADTEKEAKTAKELSIKNAGRLAPNANKDNKDKE